MFKPRKKTIFSKLDRYKSSTSNIAFMCNRRFKGFTIGKLYKPFAYGLNRNCYKDFAIFDDFGRVLFMQYKYVQYNIFSVVHTSYNNFEQVTKDIQALLDSDYIEDKFKYIRKGKNK